MQHHIDIKNTSLTSAFEILYTQYLQEKNIVLIFNAYQIVGLGIFNKQQEKNVTVCCNFEFQKKSNSGRRSKDIKIHYPTEF